MCDLNKNSIFNQFNHKNKIFNSFIINKLRLLNDYYTLFIANNNKKRDVFLFLRDIYK